MNFRPGPVPRIRLTRFVLAATFGVALFLLTACGGSGGGGGESGASAEDYPDQAISYVQPFDPGGESDITARLQQQPLEEALGVSVTVSNQPGGGGALGWSDLTRTEPNGYTVMGYNLPHIILQPLVRDDAGYSTDQIEPVYTFEFTPNTMVVGPDSENGSLEEFIAAAEADPGAVTVGGSGEFTANHIGMLRLEQLADIDLTYVPFSGTGAAVPALLGGQVDALMTYNTAALDVQDQGATVIAVASEEPVSNLPDAPTFTGLGYELVGGAYRGAAVPPDTPDEIKNTLAEAFREVNNNPEVVEQMRELGFEIVNMGPQESEEFIEEQRLENIELLEDLGLIEGGT